jgi:hypothetical protein
MPAFSLKTPPRPARAAGRNRIMQRTIPAQPGGGDDH